jgi:predicted O-methyltransferase YrrM
MKSFDKKFVQEFLDLWNSCDETKDLDQIAQGKTTLTEDGRRVALKWQVNVRYAKFLYTHVKMFMPNKILEVGMANGISSAYMAKAQNAYLKKKDAHIIIDPFQSSQWHNAGVALLKRFDLFGNVRVIEDYSFSAIPQLRKEGYRFDFAFIDGNHCLDHTLSDLVSTDKVLDIGGLILFDDCADFGVKYAITYMDRYRYNLKRIKFEGRLVHFLRELTKKRRRISVYQKVSEDTRAADSV